MPTEKPVLFSSPMVRAILAGQKTQTRRVVADPRNMIQKIGGSGDADNDPAAFGYFAEGRDFSGWMVLARGVNESVGNNQDRCSIPCPYDTDRLWVRETWAVSDASEGEINYLADGSTRSFLTEGEPDWWERWGKRSAGAKWQPSIYMPRWACRLTLAIESIRVERLNDISEEDARAEGVTAHPHPLLADTPVGTSARDEFADLWQSINGKRPGCSWAANPWVWVVTFSRVTP